MRTKTILPPGIDQSEAEKRALRERRLMEERLRRKRRRKMAFLAVFLLFAAIALVLVLHMQSEEPLREPKTAAEGGQNSAKGDEGKTIPLPDYVTEMLIPIDGTSRRGVELEGVNNIVLHYVANPGTTAEQNRNWYANPESEVSSHFLVGIDGEVILCVPLSEKSSASNHRNRDTISIEVCHEDETGKFSDAAYRSVVKLCAYLLERYGLDEEDIIRHYDITGKLCPIYFVENENAWYKLLADVKKELKK